MINGSATNQVDVVECLMVRLLDSQPMGIRFKIPSVQRESLFLEITVSVVPPSDLIYKSKMSTVIVHRWADDYVASYGRSELATSGYSDYPCSLLSCPGLS